MNFKLGLRFCSKIIACGLLLGSLLPVSVQAQTVGLGWKRQLGTSTYDRSQGVATDSNGNVYISGFTDGPLAGTNNAGTDAWVAKYNSSGTLVWKRQLGLLGPDVYSYGVATDSNGNVYISGSTDGDLAGKDQTIHPNDAFVAKYNTDGTLLWKRQTGDLYGDSSSGVATDGNGNVYIAGRTDTYGRTSHGSDDGFVTKYNSSGTLVWKREFGSSEDEQVEDVATDSNGNVYVSGYTEGTFAGGQQGEEDAWVAKYNSTGTLVWKRQLGSSASDVSNGVETDSSGNVYISGYTLGSLAGTNNSGIDAWVAKYNSSGALVWKRQLGLLGSNVLSYSLASDPSGNVYLSGYTDGDLAGVNRSIDAWVAKYNSSGALVWKRQLGSISFDYSLSVATDSNSNVYFSGFTGGSLGGDFQGINDAFVIKLTQ